MSTPLELKVDRIEKLMVEAIEMIGRVDGKVDALSEEVKQLRTYMSNSHKEMAVRFMTYEEDLRRLRMEFRMLDDRLRLVEEKS